MSTLSIIGWSILFITWISIIYWNVGKFAISQETRILWARINIGLSIAAFLIFVFNLIYQFTH